MGVSNGGKDQAGQGDQDQAVVDGNGLHVGVRIKSASPHEVKLVEATLDTGATAGHPERLIGDKAYDSDALDLRLEAQL
jgi:hypothetical protein